MYHVVMEQFINSTPKPVLAIIAILLVVFFLWNTNPPHTVCDAELAQKKETLQGILFPQKIKKHTNPPKIQAVKEACQLGNSAGSCYEYFDLLRDLAQLVSGSTSECMPKYFKVPEIQKTLKDGVEVMARIAWGSVPPDPAAYSRYSWMQEAEISTFCRIKSVYIRGAGEGAYEELRKQVSAKFPGEKSLDEQAAEVRSRAVPENQDGQGTPGEEVEPVVKLASETLSEQEIFSRSLFAVRCEAF